MKNDQGTNRRDFIKKCVAGAVVIGAGDAISLAQPARKESPSAKSKVVIARDPLLRGDGSNVDPKRVADLLDNAMKSYFGTKNPVDPWKKLVKKGEVIGLKVNTIAAPGLSNNVVLVEAICERLQQAGIKPGDIVVWDRTDHELLRAGFKLSTDPNKVRYMSTETAGYEEEPINHGTVSSRLSKILTRICTAQINLPLMKDHRGAGVTLAMKNMYGVIHNPSRCHGNLCNPFVADLYALPAIKDKFRFVICDAINATYQGGPGYRPQFAWKFNGLILAHDPVALDYTGWQLIEKKRAEEKLPTLEAAGYPPRYIETAADAQHQLGTNDPSRISVIEV